MRFLVTKHAETGGFDVKVAVDYSNANRQRQCLHARVPTWAARARSALGDTARHDPISRAVRTAPVMLRQHPVGDEVTLAYQVANAGTAGRAARRVADGGGRRLTDARLAGSGVTAGDFGPLAVGVNSGPYGATRPGGRRLVGQSVAIVNNFDNVAGQVLAFEGAVYAAAPNAQPGPVAFGNRHVGDAVQALSLTNTAVADTSEALNASLALDAGAVGVNAGGAFNLLAAGATNNADLVVSLGATTAGAKSGTATLSLVSDGFGTSGLGQTALASQTVDISGAVYRFAEASAHTPAPVAFGNRHVGDVVQQALSVSNTAGRRRLLRAPERELRRCFDTRIQTAGTIDLPTPA